MTHEPSLAGSRLVRLAIAATVVALVGAACGAADQADETTTSSSTTVTTSSDDQPQPTTSDAPPSTTLMPDPGSSLTIAPGDDLTGPIDPALAGLTGRAVSDLASRLGVDEDTVVVVRAESVVWPDSSYGCPQPGMNYLQVLSDGFWIVLSHDDVIYEYRGGGSVDVALCEASTKPRPIGGGS